MRTFHITVHWRPSQTTAGPTVELDGLSCATLSVPRAMLAEPFPCSFEDACERLAALPRMFVEPDGYILWAGEDPVRWQIDGMLFDLSGRLRYVELKGACPLARFNALLDCLGAGSDAAPLFLLQRSGYLLDRQNFQRWCWEE